MCTEQGKSGELRSCLQYLDSTWKLWSQEYIGYVAPVTEVNEMYVATLKVQEWIDSGASDWKVFLYWNGGDGREKRGVNQYGIEYNTVQYAQKALVYLSR